MGLLKKWSKIWGAKSWVQKTGCKKQGHCYSRWEKADSPLPFLNKYDPAFCNPYFGPVFKVSDPKKISGRPNKVE